MSSSPARARASFVQSHGALWPLPAMVNGSGAHEQELVARSWGAAVSDPRGSSQPARWGLVAPPFPLVLCTCAEQITFPLGLFLFNLRFKSARICVALKLNVGFKKTTFFSSGCQ